MNKSRLRVVIVNYNGGDLLRRAVTSVLASEWEGPLDVVVIDNDSSDDSLESIRGLEGVTVIRRPSNEGFGANNHGFAELIGEPLVLDLPEPDYVALLNPDATVRPSAFARLAERIDPDRRIGAAAPHIIFDRPFVEIPVTEGRVVILEVDLDGENLTSECHPIADTYRIPGARAPIWICSAGGGIRVPIHEWVRTISVRTGANSTGTLHRHQVKGRARVEFDMAVLPSMNVVQNAGTELSPNGTGRNRGFAEIDGARGYSVESPAWCGAAVLFHSEYLRDIGGFEPSYFLYYEDVDLALRGLARGWSTVYVPAAVVEHRHSDRATQGSSRVEVLQHKNRLLMLTRNAPLTFVARAWIRAAITPISLVTTAFRKPRLARAHLRLALWRVRSFVGALRAVPRALAGRRSIGKIRQVPARAVLAAAVRSEPTD